MCFTCDSVKISLSQQQSFRECFFGTRKSMILRQNHWMRSFTYIFKHYQGAYTVEHTHTHTRMKLRRQKKRRKRERTNKRKSHKESKKWTYNSKLISFVRIVFCHNVTRFAIHANIYSQFNRRFTGPRFSPKTNSFFIFFFVSSSFMDSRAVQYWINV